MLSSLIYSLQNSSLCLYLVPHKYAQLLFINWNKDKILKRKMHSSKYRVSNLNLTITLWYRYCFFHLPEEKQEWSGSSQESSWRLSHWVAHHLFNLISGSLETSAFQSRWVYCFTRSKKRSGRNRRCCITEWPTWRQRETERIQCLGKPAGRRWVMGNCQESRKHGPGA
jgi:hypothetical protein